MSVAAHALVCAPACRGLRLMSGIIHCFSSVFTEADTLNQTQSIPVLLISLASLFWGPLDLLAVAGISRRDAKPCGQALHVGCGDPNSGPLLHLSNEP